ncbi:hypothetical protein N0V88_007755 [Collariella sp. IMI 366227]|nr:hypothetical protein N0V88_007755 [Collariella sp. IMI 366227]
MKFSALCLAGFAAGTFGKCITKPCTGTSIETSFDVVTLPALTTTITGQATTIYAKREEPTADPASQILVQCGNAASRVSSACGCILSTTSTVTIVETVTATEAAEAIVTTTETITTGATATEYATPTVTVTQPIVNGNFEGYLKTANILPWNIGGTGGRVETINGVNPCSSSGGGVYCAGGSVVIRAFPPNTAGGYASIQETFTAKASSTYNLSFMYRCLNYDANTRIEAYFQGTKIGTSNGCANTSSFTRVTSGMQFTTDETGTGSLEIRFVNQSGSLPYLYFYADDFQATRVQ